jgi:hypothetical protein
MTQEQQRKLPLYAQPIGQVQDSSKPSQQGTGTGTSSPTSPDK